MPARSIFDRLGLLDNEQYLIVGHAAEESKADF